MGIEPIPHSFQLRVLAVIRLPHNTYYEQADSSIFFRAFTISSRFHGH